MKLLGSDLSDHQLDKMAHTLADKLAAEINDLIKKQLKEVAFQLTLFADSMDDKR